MTLNMKLRRWTFKSISFMHTLSALFTWTFIIRGRKIRPSSGKGSPSWFSPSSWWRRINNSFCFSSNFFAMNSLLNINWVMSKNIFISCLLIFFITSLFFRMWLEIIFNNAVKDWISYSCCDILSTSNTLLFFSNYQISQTCSTKSMVTWLHAYWNIHDFITERACYLFFNFTGKTVCFFLFFFLFLLLLFCLLLLFHFLLFLLS